MNVIAKKLVALPQFIQDVILLDECNEANVKLRKEFNLTDRQLSALLDCENQIFFKAVPLDELARCVPSAGVSPELAPKIAAHILGNRFLVADEYFNGAVSKNLAKLGADVKQFAAAVERQKKAIAAYQSVFKEAEAEEYQAAISSDKVEPPPFAASAGLEKNDAEKVFAERIAAILQSTSEEMADILEDYNLVLVNIIANDQDKTFTQALASALRSNQEKLTHKEFVLEGKPERPTISHWLKDFIKQHGASIFDNVTLSRYLTNSPNAKILSEAERQILRRLLLVYRNVQFFPESVPKGAETWDIIPVYRPEQLAKTQEKRERISTTRPRSDSELFLAELQALARQYPAGSLERRAIEEEIQKISNSKF